MPNTAETPENRRKRLKFRSWHRGVREMDLILGHFADAALDGLSDAALAEYEALIEVPDTTLYNWITGVEPVAAAHDNGVFAQVRAFGHKKEALGKSE